MPRLEHSAAHPRHGIYFIHRSVGEGHQRVIGIRNFLGDDRGAPALAAQTASQTWTEGKVVSLALPANTFVDPQGQSLVYAASLSSGLTLPPGSASNATSKTFSGTAPATSQSLTIKVTATDSSGLAASESFAVSVQPVAVAAPVAPKPAITVAHPTAGQTWTGGQSVNLVLPSNTFTDALGLKMNFAAYEVSGPNVTSWLRFNSSTDT